jgi:hypothetical protein
MAGPLKNFGKVRLKELPVYLKKSVKSFNKAKLLEHTWSFLYNYNEKYIMTGSIRPLNDVLIVVGILSYAVGWPTELRHLRHAEETAAKKQH